MRNIARLSDNDRRELFRNTADKMGLNDAIVEKDFWVCFTLDYLFHRSPWKESITFKGGTSLSKAFHLISRFSEDIDLILDWRVLGYGKDEPWEKRSNTKQDAFNKEAKENGKPLEFDSKADAENYAKEANEHTTANVRYYVKEKEPEPGAVRKGTSQPELDARSHEEVIPRNDAAEKQNEIPGRQIPSQTDPLVEIRSAVHSNYAGMVAMLGADNRVYLGREERCHYQDMQPSYYDNQDGSLCFVCDQPDMYYFLYGEGWAHTQTEMLERGLTLRQYEEFARLQNGVLAQFTTQREILFAGQPFQAPESYLRNAELYEEGQTGNYNMLDGRLNNEPPVRPDLTDGQTDEEIRELVPEAKPSLMDRLKADKPEHEARQMIPPVPERER